MISPDPVRSGGGNYNQPVEKASFGNKVKKFLDKIFNKAVAGSGVAFGKAENYNYFDDHSDQTKMPTVRKLSVSQDNKVEAQGKAPKQETTQKAGNAFKALFKGVVQKLQPNSADKLHNEAKGLIAQASRIKDEFEIWENAANPGLAGNTARFEKLQKRCDDVSDKLIKVMEKLGKINADNKVDPNIKMANLAVIQDIGQSLGLIAKLRNSIK